MKHVVFLTGSYFPDHSAVSNCVEKVVDNLKDNIKITVISPVNKEQNNEYIRTNNYTLKNFYYFPSNKFERRINRLLNKYSLDEKLIKCYIEELNNISEDIDLVVAASMPYETVKAALEYKSQTNKEVKVVPYLFDPYLNNENLHYSKVIKFIKKRWLNKFEEEILNNSFSVIAMHHLKKHIDKKKKTIFPKIEYVEHPLLSPDFSNLDVKLGLKNNINFVYCGSFYKKIRNPQFFLELSIKLTSKNENIVDIYSFGDCDEQILRYSKKHSGIRHHGSVKSSVAAEKMKNADVLIALGNTTNSQSPSKIFEYMSYGKYILYICKNDNDRNLEVLSHYPKAIILKEDMKNTKIYIDEIFKIIKCSINVSEQELLNIFKDATPEYTGKIITKLIND